MKNTGKLKDINIKLLEQSLIIKCLSIFFISSIISLFAFTDKTHQNMPEDAMLFMEKEGSLQMQWAADYLKAKSGGRYTGSCWDNCGNEIGKPNEEGCEPTPYECGAIGIARQGGVAPDYVRDAFWDDFSMFNWHVTQYISLIPKNNFSSWFHFINLLKKSEAGKTLKTNNHNSFDGYSYNESFGFPDLGIDYAMATVMNDAHMTIDLPNCTECTNDAGKFTMLPGNSGNPAVDYRQNDSSTPLGSPRGGKKLGDDDGTNYNCFSDTWLDSCPDIGTKVGGTYQIPNTCPGCGEGWTDWTGDQDWVIYEPADNPSTFYYNEYWMEGGNSRNRTLQTSSASGRYYSVTGYDFRFLAAVTHWCGDMNQQSHIWSTIGYNHAEYEEEVDEHYGPRIPGGTDPGRNYENYAQAKAYLNVRAWRYENGATVENILMENAFLTYHVRLRSGHDTLMSSSSGTRKNAGTWAVNNAVATMSVVFEKGVLELRKYR